MDAHLWILERAAAVLGARLSFEPGPLPPAETLPYGEDEIANRIYLLGRRAAKRLTAERLAHFRDWLTRARTSVGDYPYFRQWLEIVDEGPDAVAAMLTRRDEVGRYMRSVTTFRPFISQAEREDYFRRELPPGAAAL